MTSRPGNSPASRILVVADVRAVLDVMCDALRGAGFEVDPAQSVAQAIALMATRRYAVILADVFLPGTPAVDWLAAIRGAAPDTPVILVTGSVSLDEVNALAAEWCAADVIHKPFSPADLVDRVRRAVHPPP